MLKVYNTLSQKKEVFRPRVPRQALAFAKATAGKRGKQKAKLFVCGPTVYDFSHLGHARTYIAFDMIVKYLRQKGYDVFYLQNITDVDDKIINRAKEGKTDPEVLARYFEKEYFNDMKTLKVDSVTKYAKASLHIKEIISQVERLLEKGFAYRIEDGIYYNISKFNNYGKLSRRTILQAEDAVSRIDEAIYKKNKGDFCLWKFSKSGEPTWRPAPSGRSSPRLRPGRPGWHIEDTAITEKFLGSRYDMHGGARDLIFPHHEAEIAQMEAISGKKPMVKYWLHTGFLTVEGQKMAKSSGNFITIRDFINGRGILPPHSPRLLRFLIIKSHYRSPLDYSGRLIAQTKRELEHIDEFVEKLKRSDLPKLTHRNIRRSNLNISKFKINFGKAMEDDFNTPKAIAAIFELINQANSLMDQNLLSQSDAKKILEFFREVDEFFNFIFWQKPAEKIPMALLHQVEQRQKYRNQGNWQKADELRKEIKDLGWWVEDTKKGPKIKKL